MTRINVVPVSELSNLHLLAEYRELPRIFGLARKAFNSGKLKAIPDTYRMGTGHVTFFYDKLLYCFKRQQALVAELERRGYRLTHNKPETLLDGAPIQLMNDYNPTESALAINRQRIADRNNARV